MSDGTSAYRVTLFDGTVRLTAVVDDNGIVHLIRGYFNGAYVNYRDNKGQSFSLCDVGFSGTAKLVETATCIECLAVCNNG